MQWQNPVYYLMQCFNLQKDATEDVNVLPLWNIPDDVVQKIIAASAGDRLEWLEQNGEADEIDEWSPLFSGLTRQQCLSSKILHAIVLPHVTSHPALLAPPKRADEQLITPN